MTTTTIMMMPMPMVPLGQGHRDNVCGVLSIAEVASSVWQTGALTRGGDTGSLSSSLALFYMRQAEAPQQIAMRPRKNGGTDRARSPFARSGSIRRARTCSCASYPLHAWYAPPTHFPPPLGAPAHFCSPPRFADESGRCARLLST
jgi:hypothetical protein